MSLKRFGVVLLAVFALGAIAANSAFAKEEFEEGGSAWYTGASPGTRLPVGEASSVAATSELASENLTLETTVASQILHITWRKLVSLTKWRFWNTSPFRFSATTRFFWTLQGTISGFYSSACSVSPSESQTIKGSVGMKAGSSTVATMKLAPESGSTFATIELTGEKCPIAGLYKLTGTVFAEMSNATGTFGKKQPIKFSKAIQESAGTASSLKFGENAATLTGEINMSSETEFAVKQE